ncbi:hypothetical protein DSY3331 [Desulfitobacterium hafniense Y51]|uniref:Uncharacterized protein n=1 Tax=Desulfitobacterium hafniense (strain Y51) TaxID=138119 RepID=Q24S72_DESHY|nr:hypothetical protein DSY3331 [Desulfitobacterium hafniense Y51]
MSKRDLGLTLTTCRPVLCDFVFGQQFHQSLRLQAVSCVLRCSCRFRYRTALGNSLLPPYPGRLPKDESPLPGWSLNYCSSYSTSVSHIKGFFTFTFASERVAALISAGEKIPSITLASINDRKHCFGFHAHHIVTQIIKGAVKAAVVQIDFHGHTSSYDYYTPSVVRTQLMLIIVYQTFSKRLNF